MGYSEVLCQICGVSFNIGRIRTPQEPRKDAWGNWGPPEHPNSFVDNVDYNNSVGCPINSGCMFALRKIADEGKCYDVDEQGRKVLRGECSDSTRRRDDRGHATQYICENGDDDDEDLTYVPTEDFEDEPLEYASDNEELEDEDAMMHDVEEDTPSDREVLRDFWVQALLVRPVGYEERWKDEECEGFPAWFRKDPVINLPHLDPSIKDEMFPLYLPSPETSSSEEDAQRSRKSGNFAYCFEDQKAEYGRHVEHIAGPGCIHGLGYSGHEITVEEMRGCQTAQALVRKPKMPKSEPVSSNEDSDKYDFESLPDDEDFERTGEFFLTGLSKAVPSRDCNHPTVTPARHDCEEPEMDNWFTNDDDEEEISRWALPFHPSCFEVFKRATLSKYSRVDVNTLTSWWTLESTYEFWGGFPRDRAVARCNQQWWYHKKGTEWLAANPLFVPRLDDIFKAAIDPSPGFSLHQRAFQPLGPGTSPHDPFRRLPVELQYEVLDQMKLKDIASLCLASRVFSDLPVSYFQKRVLRKMPWLWEAWPTSAKPTQPLAYSPWATINSHEAKLKERRHSHELAKLNDYIDIVTQALPEIKEKLQENYAQALEELKEAELEEAEREAEKDKCTPFYLPPDRTNYLTLYTLITRHWKSLRGLQNRKRIWIDCQEIIKRVEKYKADGLVDDNGVIGDIRTARQQAEERRKPTVYLLD